MDLRIKSECFADAVDLGILCCQMSYTCIVKVTYLCKVGSLALQRVKNILILVRHGELLKRTSREAKRQRDNDSDILAGRLSPTHRLWYTPQLWFLACLLMWLFYARMLEHQIILLQCSSMISLYQTPSNRDRKLDLYCGHFWRTDCDIYGFFFQLLSTRNYSIHSTKTWIEGRSCGFSLLGLI